MGWPWTEASKPLPDHMPDGNSWSSITVVTPSFNQGRFIEETIRSVLLQGYPNLEYFILDGGSTDTSVEIIKKYSPWLSYWVSEPDSGQSDAINRGLQMSSGLFATWINSDDMLCKDAIVNHASRIGFDTHVVYVGDCLYVDEAGKILFTHRGRVHSLEDLLHLKTVWRSSGHIVQPETLFPRELALSVGGLNENLHNGMDYELWGKIFLAGARFQYTEIPFGMFRKYAGQKTNDGLRTTQELIDIASKLVTHIEWASDDTKKEILTDLEVCYKDSWQQSGRLARSGLPPPVVTQLRNLKDKVQLKTVKTLFRGK
jgi:glycosyltransferase involved in cell wall biosynthesis